MMAARPILRKDDQRLRSCRCFRRPVSERYEQHALKKLLKPPGWPSELHRVADENTDQMMNPESV